MRLDVMGSKLYIRCVTEEICRYVPLCKSSIDGDLERVSNHSLVRKASNETDRINVAAND